MVINTGTVLALSCPYCGKLNFHAISFFAFSGKKSLCFDCDCGQGTITITRMKSNRFVLKTGCIMCETNHIYYLIPLLKAVNVTSYYFFYVVN